MKTVLVSLMAAATLPLFAQKDASIRIYPEQGNQQIAEHLGTCIYGGLWVGPESEIPNTQGYRNDVLNALKELKIPNLRWPGGCFADEYHWMDGIGPKENRPKMVNNNWGGTIEDNSFGTHEFLNLCELLGAGKTDATKHGKSNSSVSATKVGDVAEACAPNTTPTSTAATPPIAATTTATAFSRLPAEPATTTTTGRRR